MIGVVGLLGVYFSILTLVSGWEFALSQFFEFWPFVISLAIGFGIQIGLYSYLKKAIHQHCASGKVLAVSGTTSTTAMISCCAHYLANILPAVGAAGIVTFVGQYQIQLFWFGLASNAAGDSLHQLQSGAVCRTQLEPLEQEMRRNSVNFVRGLVWLVVFLLPRDGLPATDVDMKLGERVYMQSCAACHGVGGDGKGPQAYRLKTKPRDFTSGLYKFRSTPSGSLPLDKDIERTILQGVRGTSMLAQRHLSEREILSVTRYLKTLSHRFQDEKPGEPLKILSPPPLTSGLIAAGRSKFEEAGCAECHGPDGRGDGRSAKDLKDFWGNPISPSDLTLRPFKSGQRPEDLYRTIAAGLDGTPMPSYENALSPEEQWALVGYIFSIATRERPRGMMGLVGEETQGMMIDMPAAMGGMMRGRGMMGPMMGR